MKKPFPIIVLISIELIFGILGIPSGAILLSDPSGKTMGLDFLLNYVPLRDLTIIGAWLFLVYGVVPIVVALGLWMGKRWAWTIALILAVVEVIWILGQIILLYRVGFTILQPIIGGLAIVTVYLLYRPSVKAYFD